MYYLGTHVYVDLYRENLTSVENIFLVLAFSIIYAFLSSTILIPVYRKIFDFFYLGKRNENKIFYIEKDNEKWFLMHPIEKNMFLLGDKLSSAESKEFIVMKKDELFEFRHILEEENKK